jgi:predicted DCC family thiol-disulfide oxidoreductase YuxK
LSIALGFLIGEGPLKTASVRAMEGASDQPWAVLYDGDCGFCKWLLAGLLRLDRARRLRPVALQREAASALLSDLDPEQRMASWHLVSPDGARRSGGEALPPLLRLLPGGRVPAAAFARFPGLTAGGYRWVAAHRSQLSRFVPRGAKRRADARVREREG